MTNVFSELLDDMEDRERLIDEAVRRTRQRFPHSYSDSGINHILTCEFGCQAVAALQVRNEYRRLLAERARKAT